MTEPRDDLGEQIHLLGDLLGETIIEQEGQTVFELVEAIRGMAKARSSTVARSWFKS